MTGIGSGPKGPTAGGLLVLDFKGFHRSRGEPTPPKRTEGLSEGQKRYRTRVQNRVLRRVFDRAVARLVRFELPEGGEVGIEIGAGVA